MRQATIDELPLGRVAHAPDGAPAVGNGVLSSLGPRELRLLEPIEQLRVPARYRLLEAGDALRHVYFPAGAVFSFVQEDKRGGMPEIALVGAEGLVDATALLGADRALHRVVARIGGAVYRVPLLSSRRAFEESEPFRRAVLGFVDLLIRRLSQSVVCKLSHTVEQQFCHRLLAYAEHAPGMALELTHEQIADALGARRQGITEAARRLQAQRVIAYSRGRISVLDGAALERYACECYRRVRAAPPAG